MDLRCLRPFAPPMRLLLSSLRSASSSTIACPYLVLSSLSPFSSNYSSHAPFLSRPQEGESREARVSVWWDFESCNLPTGVDVVHIRKRIIAALSANGIHDPMQMNIFGDTFQFSDPEFNHISNGGKNSVQRSLLFNLLYWVSKNPPPAHLFLISSDSDLAYVLPHLRMKNYNILLATIDSAPEVLRSAASIMWCWKSLARKENLIGTHLNYPPDDSYENSRTLLRFKAFFSTSAETQL